MQRNYYRKSNMINANSISYIKNLITIFCVFLIICADSAFYLVNTQVGIVRMLIDLIAIILLVLLKKKIVMNCNSFFIVVFMMFFSLISGVMVSAIKQTFIIIAAITIGWLFTCVVSYSEFKNLFIKIMFFLSFFSLITFIVSIVAPQYIRLLPQVVRQGGGSNYYNALFSVICDSTYVSRNYGIFWEPGAFSIFVNIALFMELFQKKSSVKNIAVFSITILSTLSTLGIICMMFLLIGYLSKKNNLIQKKVKNFMLFLIIVFVMYLFIDGEEFIFHVLNKLKLNNGMFNETTSVRVNAFYYMGKLFLSSPIWGVGYNGFLNVQTTYCSEMATFTFINLLATYGIIGGVLPIVGCFKFFLKNIKGSILLFAMICFVIAIFSTENFMQITFLYILMFYGFCNKEVKYEYSSNCD